LTHNSPAPYLATEVTTFHACLPIYLKMRRMPLCEKPPWGGEPVIVVVRKGSRARA
jgi:hypothetical protein